MGSSPDQPVGARGPVAQSPPAASSAVGLDRRVRAAGAHRRRARDLALGLQSDLDSQRDQTNQAQAQAEQANKEVDALSGQIDDISQAITDAGDQLSQAGDDAQKNAQTTLDGVETKLESVKGQVEKAAADSDGSPRRRRHSGSGVVRIHAHG